MTTSRAIGIRRTGAWPGDIPEPTYGVVDPKGRANPLLEEFESHGISVDRDVVQHNSRDKHFRNIYLSPADIDACRDLVRRAVEEALTAPRFGFHPTPLASPQILIDAQAVHDVIAEYNAIESALFLASQGTAVPSPYLLIDSGKEYDAMAVFQAAHTMHPGPAQAATARNPKPAAANTSAAPITATTSGRLTSTNTGNNTCVRSHPTHLTRRGRNGSPTPSAPLTVRLRAHPDRRSTPAQTGHPNPPEDNARSTFNASDVPHFWLGISGRLGLVCERAGRDVE